MLDSEEGIRYRGRTVCKILLHEKLSVHGDV